MGQDKEILVLFLEMLEAGVLALTQNFKQVFKTLQKDFFPLSSPSVFLISQDSAEGVEEAGALPKLPVFGAPAAQGVSPGPEKASPTAEGIPLGSEESPAAEGATPGLEKENPAVESPGEEPQSPEAEQPPSSEAARAAAGDGAGAGPGSGAAPSTAAGDPAQQPAKTEAAPSENAAQEPKKISYSQIVREGRRFNIDLVSKVGTEWLFLCKYFYFA